MKVLKLHSKRLRRQSNKQRKLPRKPRSKLKRNSPKQNKRLSKPLKRPNKKLPSLPKNRSHRLNLKLRLRLRKLPMSSARNLRHLKRHLPTKRRKSKSSRSISMS